MPVTRRLAVLLCGDIRVSPHIKTIHGGFHDMFRHLLSSSLAQMGSDATFTLDAYDVASDMAYPPDSVHYDGIFLSGSPPGISVYDNLEWINKLATYIKRIVTDKPALKIFGVCFGHQIIAKALGGACTPNDNGPEVGVTTIQLSSVGKAIFGSDQLDIQQLHSDHVPTAPPNAHILGWTTNTANHGMVIFDSTSPIPSLDDLSSEGELHVPLTSVQVLTLQGHPEFTGEFMTVLLDTYLPILGENVINDGHLREGGIPGKDHCHADGLASDGVGRVGKAIWGILGVVA